MNKALINSGLKILWNNPSLLKSFFSGSFDNIYCSYWHSKLSLAKKYYHEFNSKNKEFLEIIENGNSRILNSSSYSRHEAYFIPLYLLVRELKPDVVVETGVHRGVSSFFILQALEENENGTLYSIDLPLGNYRTDSGVVTKSFLPAEKVGVCVPNQLRKRWELILGDSKEELPKILEKNKIIDLFIHDSKHTYEHMMWEFDIVWSHIKNGGFLVSDDINWNGSFNDFVRKIGCASIQLRRDKERGGTFGVISKKDK